MSAARRTDSMGRPLTRGERNKNPGNIERSGTKWVGVASEQLDSRFLTFATPAYGIRAIVKILMTYYRKHKLDTPRKIIGRWAPPSENDTDAYAGFVAGRLGVAPSTLIEVLDWPVMLTMVRAIVRFENGRDIYPESTYADALRLAGMKEPGKGSA